jgi:formyl-CoA transferase
MRGVFPRLSETPGRVDHAGPELGEHAREVLRERAGLTDGEIDALLDAGATTCEE